MKKKDLIEKVRRRLGHPVIKVELDYDQMSDAVDYARSKFIKWAVGQAVTETFFTICLSAGQSIYDMPTGTVDVVTYETEGTNSGINTLFTVENFLNNQGMFDALIWSSGHQYNLISYHIARDFLETLDRYVVDRYNFKYHPYTNQLEIQPPPTSGSSLTLSDGSTVDSPGFILIRAYMIEGSTLSSWTLDSGYEDFYEHSTWIFDYATAQCKMMLGRIRSKFASFNSLGNQPIALDGDTLLSEAIAEIERLDETLKTEECYEGYSVIMG